MVKVKKTSRNISSSSNEGQKGLKGQKETLEPPQYTEEDAIQFHNQQQK